MSRVGRPFVVCLSLSLAFAGAGATAADETYRYRSLGVSDGLSQGFVTAIAQDPDGFLWFGSLSGLDRYDGRRFERHAHAPDDPSSLGAGAIYAMHVDRSGRLWVATESGLDRFEPAAESFVHYTSDPEDSRTSAPGRVRFIDSDSTGRVWFGSSALNRLDPASGIVSRFPIENPGDRELTLVSVDSADRLWIATAALDRARAAQGAPALVAYDLARTGGGGALPPPLLRAPLPPGTLEVLAVAEDRSGRVWWGLDGGGLLRFDPASGAWTRLDPQHDGREDFLRASVRSLAVDTDGAIWALVSADSLRGGQGPVALYRIDPEILTATPIDLGPEIAGPGDSAPLMSLAVDRSGVLWLSTNAGGLRYVDVSARGFHLYRSGYPLAFGSDFVRAILKSADGALWIGTPAGVHRIDRSTGETRSSGVDGFLPLPGPNVQSILEDRQGRIWVGTASGLARLDPVTGKVDHFRHDAANPASLSDDWVLTIHEDAQGTLWFGGFRGLDALDAETGRFVHHRALPEDPTTLPDETVAALYDDHAGRLWVGTGAGLATGSGGPPGPVRFRRVPIAGGGAGEGEVSAIRERQEEPGVLWLGHLGQGLTRLETATGAARHYTTRNSDLPDDTVYAILDDPDGRLWMSTNRGLVRFDPDAGAFTTFGLDRGLQSLEFNARSYFSSDDGEMFFGGVAGFNAFRPEEIRPNAIAPEVRITHVSALDRSGASPIAPFELLFRRGMPAGSLTLDSRQRDVRFEFAALHFSHPESNRFSYFLQGYDSAWRPATTIQEATYTNLAPGRYTFRVRAMSSHGVWSEGSDSISFTIRPPFYATPWFYALSGLAFAGALAGVYFWRLGELHRRQRNLELEVASRTAELSRTLTLVEEQAGKLQELDRAKSRFFANVSHEFRTPLTLTLGPLEDLLRGRHGPLSKDAVAELELALRNTRRQAQLVDRLLMLAALDAGSLKLRLAHRRLDELVRFVAAPFESHAKRLGLDLRVEIPPDALWARCDEEKVEQVLGNLLSNACKYTPRGGHIEVRLQGSGTVASIEVADSGIGIPEESLLRIFDRFYRVGSEGRGQPGTGIGLSLAKELVELHGGSLRAESRPGAGSRFTVELPIADGGPAPGPEAAEALQEPQGAPSGFLPSAPGEFEDGEQATGASEPASGERPEILVVDDHPEMRAFLRRQLEEGYQIAEAEDGAEALRRASERVPDLIVSDVSMDGMDGFALCRAVRADPELEHVPVVLLTARADLESRIEGLEGGADDYLVKPFESRELLARVRNLLEVRARLRNVLVPERPRAVPAPEPVAASSADEVFLARLQEVLNRHAFEETFSVTELARRLAVGRTHLYRRLEEVCAASPSEVIFDFRLERAAQLLARRAGNVGEVAYAVGFKNVSHFVRRFRERYGTTPAAYASGARRDP